MLIISVCSAETIDLKGWDKENGYQYVRFGSYAYETDGEEFPVTWRVLSVNGTTAYVQSAEIIDVCKATKYSNETTVYKMLNKFLFTRAERDALLTGSMLSMADLENEVYGFRKGIMNDDTRIMTATPYAMSKGIKNENSNVSYWTNDGHTSCYVNPNGAILPVTRTMMLGIAPVLRINTEILKFDQGSGTRENPYFSSLSERCITLENSRMYLNLKQHMTISNPLRETITVYSGPGREYFVFDGSKISLHRVSVNVMAHDGRWLMIEFLNDAGYRQIGYIAVEDIHNTLGKKFFDKLPVISKKMYSGITRDMCVLYDSIAMQGDAIYVMDEGQPIKYIGYEIIEGKPMVYIETQAYNKPVRGFVELEKIELDDYDLNLLQQIF
ncbi:MAG: hypothetical protein Q4C54_03425 [Clostridia bacterium]|nr:hypothetical protein [Clostridia bacterium]